MKKALFIISCVLLPIAGFLAYSWWHERQKADVFELVPASAVAVMETTEFYSNWETMKNSGFWKNLQSFPLPLTLNGKMFFLDSAAGGNAQMKSFFHGKKVISSLHVISNQESEYIFYIPLEKENDQQLIDKLLANTKTLKTEERAYGGITISEFSIAGQKKPFSVIRYRNLLIGSYAGYLLEDVIRIINQETRENFLSSNPEVRSSAHAHSDTYIYISYKKISTLAFLLGDIQTHDFLKSLDNFAGHSVLDYKMGEGELLLDGFTYSKKDSTFLSVFAGQKPQKFLVKSYIPNNTGILYYYGFGDPARLNESLMKFWQIHDPSILEKRTRMNEESGIDINELFPEFGNEAALCLVKPSRSFSGYGRLLFIESENADKFFLKLNKFVTIKKDGRTDTLLYEKQGPHLIREMNIPELPSLLLGDMFIGFKECYYTKINNYIVFADQAQHLRELITNIDSENVWSKSPAISGFLDKHFSPTNISLLVNTPLAWKHLMSSSSAGIRQSMQESPEVLKKISPILFQFNIFQDKIYTNIVLSHDLNRPIRKEQYAYEKESEVEVPEEISSCLYAALSANPEFLVQGKSNTIYKIGRSNIRWKDTLNASVDGKVLYADLDKDGRKDFLLAAGNKIYALDTSGKSLKGFPVVLADSVRLEGLSLVDYDGKGDYRIMTNDIHGVLYLFDKRGGSVGAPRPLERLTSPLRHVRVKNKDYMIALQRNGKLAVMNRKGEMYKGFPVTLDRSCSSPVFITEGADPEKTIIHVLTDEGMLVKINLMASVLDKLSFTHEHGLNYQLLPDGQENSFMVSVQTS
ncbi:MAG: hypothetical protein ACJ75J_10220, partial [Cytophagaceae bacterium]